MRLPIRGSLQRVEGKLGNQDFLTRAPAPEVAKQQGRADELRVEIDRLKELL